MDLILDTNRFRFGSEHLIVVSWHALYKRPSSSKLVCSAALISAYSCLCLSVCPSVPVSLSVSPCLSTLSTLILDCPVFIRPMHATKSPESGGLNRFRVRLSY